MAANSQEIDTYIRGLDYDPNRLLSVVADGSTSSMPVKDREAGNNAVIICTKTQHSLKKNLSDVAILNPAAGVVFPGALIRADTPLAEGRPTPSGLARGPLTLSLDLPGLANPTLTVPEGTNSAVQTALNGRLEEWSRTTAAQGYVNAARSFHEVKTAYSSQQVSLELGFNAKWASGNASSLLSTSSNSETSSVIAFYKQVFYSVTMDTPARPSSVFADAVSRGEVAQEFDAHHPPAYVRSVDYGRLLLIRMETSAVDRKAKLEAAFNQTTSGGVELGGTTDNSYAEIVKNSTFTVVAIGGGAQTAASFSGTEEGLKNLRTYIGKDATYRRDNPGLPISYTVAFLKDGQLAKMGASTDYTETDCVRYPNGFIRLASVGAYVARFNVAWEEPDAAGVYGARNWESGNQTAGYSQQLDLPGDARTVRIKGECATGLVWRPWGEAVTVTETGPTNKLYKIGGTTLNPWNEITAVA